MQTLLWLIPFPPLVAFALISLFTRRSRGLSHWVALIGTGLSWLGSMLLFFWAVGQHNLEQAPLAISMDWLPIGDSWLRVGALLDPLAALTLFFVAWTVFMILIYSVGYHNYGQPAGPHDLPGLPPHGVEVAGSHAREPSVEPMYSRFFAFISLFAFAMFALVVADNLLVLYAAWEIMGLCSYLLIGFWYARPSARDAAIKAFLTTRVGDMFMLLGMVALYSLTGTLNYREILADPVVLSQLATTLSPVFGLSWAALIGLLIFAGTIGKSAQFPLHTWLPDAMEGPTPVSAMIHAAAMVSAGVFLSARFFPLISAGWHPGGLLTTPMLVMSVIGSFTALFAALIALGQRDIKRVLAYSTISQLGYMVAALGIGAYNAAVFHLFTHAFFKALLFLGSGSVIHGMEHGKLAMGDTADPQDMFSMGGLHRKMPVTFYTYLAGALALSGFPLLTAGFWSKDEILSGAFSGDHLIVFITLAAAAFITAFYSMRQVTLTFLGVSRTPSAKHAHESKPVMTLPLVVLALFAIAAGWFGVPGTFPGLGGVFPNFIGEFLGGHTGEEHFSHIPLLVSVAVSLTGLFFGWLVHRGQKDARDPLKKLGFVFTAFERKFWVDEFYCLVLIQPATWLGEVVVPWIDRNILDGLLHAIGRFGSWLGLAFRKVLDIPVANGVPDGAAAVTKWTGGRLRWIQTGRVQQYLVTSLMLVVLAGLVVMLALNGRGVW
ncbi:MAG: NADH-quinone oxidoreductase subunit L [Anaerolineaceae bacterium]|nr:NADH-quinone oxidoreductase subunit L [Anaerolineaceae bacterium]